MKEPSKFVRALAAVGALTLTATLLVSSPTGAQVSDDEPLIVSDREPEARLLGTANLELPAFTSVPCLLFTDSIVRLYSAYFMRVPDEDGFNFWRAEFEAGRWSLPAMSTFFSESQEFNDLYGSLTDAQFIDLIYQNIFGRAADAGGRDFWLGRMQNDGLDRGTVMLNFSESPEYIDLSGTALTPAGHFNWYPAGTQFSCGFGDTEYEIRPGLPFLDIVVVNFGDTPIELKYEVFQSGTWIVVQEATLRPTGNLQAFGWALANNMITRLRFTASGNFNWSVAQSPTVIPQTRAGW